MSLDAEIKHFIGELPLSLQYERSPLMSGPFQHDVFRKLLNQHNMTMLCMESMLNLHVRC
jgi:hypothetical protein